jgi:hypothetical protein
MKHTVWDYAVDPFELYEVVTGKREKVGHLDAQRVFLRMLEKAHQKSITKDHRYSEDLEAGLDPVALHEIIRSMPEQELARVLWSFDVNLGAVRADLAAIAEDILYGKSNSFCPA